MLRPRRPEHAKDLLSRYPLISGITSYRTAGSPRRPRRSPVLTGEDGRGTPMLRCHSASLHCCRIQQPVVLRTAQRVTVRSTKRDISITGGLILVLPVCVRHAQAGILSLPRHSPEGEDGSLFSRLYLPTGGQFHSRLLCTISPRICVRVATPSGRCCPLLPRQPVALRAAPSTRSYETNLCHAATVAIPLRSIAAGDGSPSPFGRLGVIYL